MKKRPDEFLSLKEIDHDGEVFDYILELHNYLWRFVHIVLPTASGNLGDYVDLALSELEHKKRRIK